MLFSFVFLSLFFFFYFFFFSSRRRHTRSLCDWSSDVCSSDLRPGSRIAANVHIGNYVEIKNATIGSGTLIGHVSYLGDATVGERVNIGAGTITTNYDGRQKHRTTIGDGAFIGSDTMLRAPVEVGPGARTGAGAVVTRD